ncbi:MAG TPA: hypothetical protein PK772_09240 [Chitinophagaceae bacterium]|nr:hypothetical protein [Chitinophagaceae bacterium]
MNTKQSIRFVPIITLLFIFISCRRDYSYEKSLTQKIQEKQTKGFLGNNFGQCLTANINGAYLTHVETDASNTIEITATITEPGKYTITTDTVNGMFFNASGVFYNTGIFKVSLQGHGTAINTGNTTFTITFDESQCTCSLPVYTDLNTWSFWDNNKKYNGEVTFAQVFPILDRLGNVRQGLFLSGDNTRSSVPLGLFLNMEGELGASFLQPSTHYLYNSNSGFDGFVFDENNLLKYRINKTTINSFPLRIISFNRATGIMEASFEGPVLNIQNNPIGRLNITKGRFKAEFIVTVP